MTSKYSDKFILSLEFLNVILEWSMSAPSSIKFLKLAVKIATEAVHCTSIWHAKMLEALVTYPVTYTWINWNMSQLV